MNTPDEFAREYRALRVKEGWAQPDGHEDPAGGNPALWRGRVRSVSRASACFSRLVQAPGRRPLIVDAGSGGGWAARFLAGADVISVDLIAPAVRSKLSIRADMRRLPLLDRSVDGVLFAGSLHYARPQDLLPEAARVLRRGGLVVAVDSPIYRDARSRAAAAARSSSYYLKVGFPSLADSYWPLESNELRRVLTDSGFRIDRWEVASRITLVWRRFIRRAPGSMIVAQRL